MSETLPGHAHELCSANEPAPGLVRAAWAVEGLD